MVPDTVKVRRPKVEKSGLQSKQKCFCLQTEMLTVHRATGTSKPQELPLTASLFIFCSSTTNLFSFLPLLAWNSSCLKPLLSETAYTRLPEHLCWFQSSSEERFLKETNFEAAIKLYSYAEIRGVRQIRIFEMSGTDVLLFFFSCHFSLPLWFVIIQLYKALFNSGKGHRSWN